MLRLLLATRLPSEASATPRFGVGVPKGLLPFFPDLLPRSVRNLNLADRGERCLPFPSPHSPLLIESEFTTHS